MIKLTKEEILNYLIDVLGNNEEEAREILSIYGFDYLSSEQKKECYNYAN
jgi:hypothetical protein